jgi:hypothetical protein
MQSYLLYHGRIPHSFMNGVLYDKSCYYNGTLNWDYGRSVSTCRLILSPVKVLCILSWIVYSELITLHNLIAYCICWADHTLCINWIDYLLNYYRCYCSDLLYCTVFYVIMYWQVLYPLWWIAGILNKLLLLLLLWFPVVHSTETKQYTKIILYMSCNYFWREILS